MKVLIIFLLVMGAIVMLPYSPLFEEENPKVMKFKQAVHFISFIIQFGLTRLYYLDNYEPYAMSCVRMLETKRSQGILLGRAVWEKCSCQYEFWTEKAGKKGVFRDLKEEIHRDPTSGFYRMSSFGEPCTDYNFATSVECRLSTTLIQRIATALLYVIGIICFRRVIWKCLDMIC